MKPLLGAIEAGGTKFVCAVGTGPDDVRDVIRIPTTTPSETLAAVVAHLKACEKKHGPMDAIGVGTFGPAGVHQRETDYGFITTTPKPHWADTDVLGNLRKHFAVPMGFDTDVNAAALGEWKWGAGNGSSSVLYLTVGTGIGGGFCLHGKPLHGLLHPEMGHIRIPHDASRDAFPGSCPWHENCLEGLASGFAMEQRWGKKGIELPADHPAWDLEAHYLGIACANFLCTLSPKKIILGGGVLEAPGLLEKIHHETRLALNGYLRHSALTDSIATLIVRPGLGNHAGLCGAMALAADSLG
jgi:fructokinase